MALGEQDGARRCLLLAGRAPLPPGIGDGFEVLWVQDGGAAVELARSQQPIVIALDAEVEPGARQVLRQLKASDETRDIPVVLLSASPIPEELEISVFRLGAADVLGPRTPPRVQAARLSRAARDARERLALQEAAQTDGLTGLANFRGLSVRLPEEFQRANRYRYPLTAVVVDLDFLKRINDRHGHEVGNSAILAVARQLRLNLRGTDFAARFGGDEFVALLPYQAPPEGRVFAERLRASLGGVHAAQDAVVPLTVSVGIAGHTETAPRSDAEALLSAADRALYEAKRRGRDRIVVSEEERVGDAALRH